MESLRAAMVSWERSWTVWEPMRPLPHLASWARMTGPKVSQSSNHAASSFRLSRETKLVVIEFSMAALGGAWERLGGGSNPIPVSQEDTAIRGDPRCNPAAV